MFTYRQYLEVPVQTTLLYAAATAVYVILGFRYWISERHDEAHFYFLGFCLCFALWAFGYAMITLSETTVALDLWRRVGYTGGLTYEVFVLLFFLRHSGMVSSFRKRWPLAAALWVVPAFFLYANIFRNAIHESFPAGFWYIGMHVYSTAYNLASIAVVVLWVKSTHLLREKRQGLTITVGGVAAMAVTIPCDFIMGSKGLPTLTPVLVLLWIGTITFATKRYRFMDVTPRSVGPDVLRQIGDFVAVSDLTGSLILTNPGLENRIDAHCGGDFPSMFTDTQSVRILLRRLESRGAGPLPVRLSLIGESGRIPISGKFSAIEDRFGDVLGILFVGHEIVELSRLGEVYCLTDREVCIVDELTTGKPNRMIAINLGITENTVKAHVTNIYNKLGIANRIELLNLLKNSGIIVESD